MLFQTQLVYAFFAFTAAAQGEKIAFYENEPCPSKNPQKREMSA
ncbi:hypothetical protein PtrV1_02679 [Pyrenophora tritici-repentis]|nr:hypothetical protein PtrV1_02679 [Pyrenophora tritici-repentis]